MTATVYKCGVCCAIIPPGGSCHGWTNPPKWDGLGNPIRARDTQHGGDHYKRMPVQPWDVIDTWPLAERIGFYRGNLLKYTMRLNDKDAPEDNAGKAEHYAAKLREVLSETRPER